MTKAAGWHISRDQAMAAFKNEAPTSPAGADRQYLPAISDQRSPGGLQVACEGGDVFAPSDRSEP